MTATPDTRAPGIAGPVSAQEIAELMATVSDQVQSITAFQVTLVERLQILQTEQQRLAALIAAAPAQAPFDATAASTAPQTKTIEFICVGLSEDDPHFKTLVRNAPETVNLQCAGIQEALTIAKDRANGSQAIIQLFNLAAQVQTTADPQKALALCDRMFHAIRLADRLGAQVTWTVNDLPRNDLPHRDLAHELYKQIGSLPLNVIIPTSDALLAQIRRDYPHIAQKVA